MSEEERLGYIARIRSLPELLKESVDGLDAKQLETSYREGGWTIRQVVHHLADAHMNGLVRIKQVLTKEDPILPSYDQDAWADLADVKATDIAVSLDIVRGVHLRMANVFDSVSTEMYERSGMHTEYGKLTLGKMLKMYAEHGEHHADQILGLRRARSW